MHREKSAKMAIWQKNSHFAILALLSLCINFKIFSGKMTYGWVLWKSSYTLLLKKCLRPCPGLSMYLSERIDWIISSFPRWISKILFVLGSWDHFGSLGCRIGECPFSYDLILLLGSVADGLWLLQAVCTCPSKRLVRMENFLLDWISGIKLNPKI